MPEIAAVYPISTVSGATKPVARDPDDFSIYAVSKVCENQDDAANYIRSVHNDTLLIAEINQIQKTRAGISYEITKFL